jgi:hypothetical protein
MTKLKSRYFVELQKARTLAKTVTNTNRQIEDLPHTLRQYLIKAGVSLGWKDTFLKFSPKGKWRSMYCLQQNFLPDPIRLAYMRTTFMGLFSVEALDSFTHGEGGMKIRALNLFNIANSKGKEMDQSQLVTILSETIIIPTYALQRYITWEEIDAFTVKGTISCYGITASGIFHFNTDYEPVSFESSYRYYTLPDGSFQQVKWSIAATGFSMDGTIGFPTNIAATWNFPEQDYCYFKGNLSSIKLHSLADKSTQTIS